MDNQKLKSIKDKFAKNENKSSLNKMLLLIIALPFEIAETMLLIVLYLFVYIPIFLAMFVRKMIYKKKILMNENIYKKSKIINVKLFNSDNWILSRIGLIPSILIKKIKLVGNSFITEQEINENADLKQVLEFVNPGVFSLWFIRESTKIAHEGLLSTELEYLENISFKTKLSILLKSIPALLYRNQDAHYEKKLTIFDMDFDNITMADAINIIDNTIISKERKKIFFVNPDCMNKLYVDKQYFEILEKADYIFPDGIGISIACKKLGTPLIENVNGTDMLPFVCQLSQQKGYKVFLFGAKVGIAEKMKKKLEQKYNNLQIVGCRDGYFDWDKDSETIVEEINESKADILLVAFGVPLQEKWITNYHDKLKANVQIGVGGLFDFYSGQMNRAPKWMREIGMEWLYRLYKEPKRMWRRYIIGNPLFLYRVSKWKKKRSKI